MSIMMHCTILLCTILNLLAQHCTILAPRWHNLGTSLAQSWHLVGTILNLVEHNTAQYWTSLATYSNLCTLLCVYNCRLDGTFPPHPDNEQGTQMNFSDKQQVKVGVTSANEGAGVVRSGRDLIKKFEIAAHMSTMLIRVRYTGCSLS